MDLPPSRSPLPDVINLRRREPDKVGVKTYLFPFGEVLTFHQWADRVPLNILEIGQSSKTLEPLSIKDLSIGDTLDIPVFIDMCVYRADDTVPRTVVYFAFDEIVRVARSSGPVSPSSSGRLLIDLTNTQHRSIDPVIAPSILDHRYSEVDNIGYSDVDEMDSGQGE